MCLANVIRFFFLSFCLFEPKMALKTPISILQELCVKYYEMPIYKLIGDIYGTEKLFTYVVRAFGQSAQGCGQSKKEAKHAASTKLIGI